MLDVIWLFLYTNKYHKKENDNLIYFWLDIQICIDNLILARHSVVI